jgi:hypothetical protein
VWRDRLRRSLGMCSPEPDRKDQFAAVASGLHGRGRIRPTEEDLYFLYLPEDSEGAGR